MVVVPVDARRHEAGQAVRKWLRRWKRLWTPEPPEHVASLCASIPAAQASAAASALSAGPSLELEVRVEQIEKKVVELNEAIQSTRRQSLAEQEMIRTEARERSRELKENVDAVAARQARMVVDGYGSEWAAVVYIFLGTILQAVGALLS